MPKESVKKTMAEAEAMTAAEERERGNIGIKDDRRNPPKRENAERRRPGTDAEIEENERSKKSAKIEWKRHALDEKNRRPNFSEEKNDRAQRRLRRRRRERR